MAISVPCACLKATWLSTVPGIHGESRQQDLLKYLGKSCGNCNSPVIVDIINFNSLFILINHILEI